MTRCDHRPFTATAHTPTDTIIEVHFEPDCDVDGCSYVNDLPEEYEDCEIEWIASDEIALNPRTPVEGEEQRILTESTERWKDLREQSLKDMESRGTSDLAPMIEVYRDGRIVAVIQAFQVNRDLALDYLPLIVGGFAADAVVLCLDSHYTNNPTNPATGQPWGPGEMQKACDEDGACSVGLITDCLMVIEQHRDGHHRQIALPYHEDKDARVVHWHDDESIFDSRDGSGQVEGRIVDALNHAFSLQPLTLTFIREEAPEIMEGFDAELDDEAKRVHMDCAMAKDLLSHGNHAVMLNGGSERGHQIIRESFAGGNFNAEEV